MKRRGDGPGEPLTPHRDGGRDAVVRGPRRWRDRAPLLAAIVVQALVAAYLVALKLQADAQLPPGGRYPSPFYHIMATIDWACVVPGCVLLGVACLLPPQRWIDGLVDWMGRRVRLVAVATAVAVAGMSLGVQQAYPLTMDEYAPSFQAEVFARGRLAGQWPPELTRLLAPPGASFLLVSTVTGQTCSGYWPGHAALLSPFAFLGIPWALNAVLSGCCIVLLADLARRAFGERAAGWAVLFALASPVFAAYGMSFYAMTAHCTLNLLYAWLLMAPTPKRVAGAGLLGGFGLVLHNPFPHFAFSLPWLAWLAMRRDRWTTLPLIGLCYAAVFLPIDAGWRSVERAVGENQPVALFASGAEQPVLRPDVDATAAADSGGLAASAPAVRPEPAAGPWAAVGDAVTHAWGYFTTLHLPSAADFLLGRWYAFVRLVAWDAPGLLVFACLGAWRHRASPVVRLFACSGLSTFLLYSLIEMSGGHGWGYRYFFSAWGCLPFLAAGLAVDPHHEDSGEDSMEPGRGIGTFGVARSAGLAAVLGLVTCLPVRLWQIHDFIAEHRGQMTPLPSSAEAGSGDIVRFLEVREGWFRLDLLRNDPFFERGPYTLLSTGPDNDKVVIGDVAKAVGLKPRMTFADGRGSTWVLESPPPEEQPR